MVQLLIQNPWWQPSTTLAFTFMDAYCQAAINLVDRDYATLGLDLQ